MSCGKCVRVFAYCIVAGLFYSGCSTFRREVFHRTDHSRSSDYDQIRLMMDQTLAFYQPDKVKTIRESCDKTIVPDCFNYKAAASAYDAGRTKRVDSRRMDLTIALRLCARTNIEELAYHDGLSANWLANTLSPSEVANVLRKRDTGRAVLNCEFFRRLAGQGTGDVWERQAVDFQTEYVTGTMNNRYEQLWCAFVRGYKDALLLFNLTGKFPYGYAYYCDLPYPGETPVQRAYVYGWWCGGRDYFDEDDTVILTCRNEIERFRSVERMFFEFCASVRGDSAVKGLSRVAEQNSGQR